MNKKQRLILGVAIVIVILGYLAFNGVASNQYEVSEAVTTKEKLVGKIININGSMVTGTDRWDALNRTLLFKMTDGKETIDVISIGSKPDIPPGYTNIQVVATGQFEGNIFKAYKMLTKCPSKYQASPTDIGK